MKLKLILIGLLISKVLLSQSIYKGTTLDALTNQPIAHVSIQVQASGKGVVTDKDGMFEIEIKQLPTVLVISHVAYEKEEKVIQVLRNSQELIYLLPRTTALDEVTILPEGEVESISDPEQYSIQDFEINGDKIYRLEYHGLFEKYILSVTNLSGKKDGTLKLSSVKGIEQLYKSCNNSLYVLTGDVAYPVKHKDDNLTLGQSVRRDTFVRFIQPCQLNNGYELYYINKFYNGLMSVISMYDVKSGESRLIREISNKKQLELYRSDLNLINRSRVATNIFTNDVVENKRIRNLQKEGDFLKQVFYKPEYPVFLSKRGKHLVILNHIERKIELYVEATLTTEVEVDYVEEKNWLKAIKVDPVTEKIYGVFDLKKGIGLKEIDVKTGETKLVSLLDISRQQANKIKVFDNIIYYLKPSHSNNAMMELVKQGL